MDLDKELDIGNKTMVYPDGVDGGIRTLKLSPTDFKSVVYAVPPHRRVRICQQCDLILGSYI